MINLPPLPLWLIGIVLVLCVYPIIKFVQWLFLLKKKQVSIEYGGLLWKKEGEQLNPLCPQCLHDVVHYEYGKEMRIPRQGSLFRTSTEIQYISVYECPKHGKLEVANDDFNILWLKANSIYKQRNHRILNNA